MQRINTIDDLLSKKIISKRTYNVCKYNNLLNEEEIYNLPNFAYKSLRNCGKKSIQELINVSINFYKLSLSGNINKIDLSSKEDSLINILIKDFLKVNAKKKLTRKLSFVQEFFSKQKKQADYIIKSFIKAFNYSTKINSENEVKTYLINNGINLDTIGNKKLIELYFFNNLIYDLSEEIKTLNEKEKINLGLTKYLVRLIFHVKKINDIQENINEIKNNFRRLISMISEKKYDALKTSLNLLYNDKDGSIINSFLNGYENKEIGKFYNFTTERIRQKIEIFIKNEEVIELYNILIMNSFDKFESTIIYDNSDIIVSNTKSGEKGRKASNKKLREYLQKIDCKYNFTHIPVDVSKILNLKHNYHLQYMFPNFLIKKELFNKFEKFLFDFYVNLNKKDNPIKTDDYDEDFILLIKKYKDYLFPYKNVFIDHPYTYCSSRISIPFLCELSISESKSETKTLRIEEIYNWIKINFPNKKITGIDGIRSGFNQSKNIIAFGKTGNYGLKKDFKINKSSDISTKNLIIRILKKNKFPVRLDIIEDYVRSKNPFLKERSVPMIIDINPKTFIRFTESYNKIVGQSFIGLKKRNYSELPVYFNTTDLKKYLKSKNLAQEWLSFEFIKEKFNIPNFQIMDYCNRYNYLVFDEMITLSSNSKRIDELIMKTVKNENLIKHVKNYLRLNLSEKTLFKKKLRTVLEKEHSIKLKNNHISKIINFII